MNTPPTQLTFKTSDLVDQYNGLLASLKSDRQSNGDGKYYSHQLSALNSVFKMAGISMGDNNSTLQGEAVLEYQVLDTQEFLDLYWSLMDSYNSEVRVGLGNGDYFRDQLVLLGEVLKLGGLNFNTPNDIPKTV